LRAAGVDRDDVRSALEMHAPCWHCRRQDISSVLRGGRLPRRQCAEHKQKKEAGHRLTSGRNPDSRRGRALPDGRSASASPRKPHLEEYAQRKRRRKNIPLNRRH
jgi:hypothetical protein